MTQNGRELAERLCLALPDCVGLSHDTIECLMRLYPDQFQNFAIEARELITAELAAKAGPPGDQVPIPQNIMQARGMLLVAENWLTAHDPKFKPNEILATLTAKADAARAENERLREASKRYMGALKSLGERVPGKSYVYFEANLRENDGAMGRWRELNDAGVELCAALSATDAREAGR